MNLKSVILISILICGLLISPVSAAAGDTILFEQVNISSNITQIWNNGSFQVYPVVQGVTSTDNIDQSQLLYSTVTYVGANSGTNRKIAQSFVANKSQLTSISWITATPSGSPVGNFKFSIQTDSASAPSGVILASTTITNTTLTGYGMSYVVNFNVPAILTPGTTYWMVGESTATETGTNYWLFRLNGTASAYPMGNYAQNEGSWTTDANSDMWFKTYYAKNTEAVNVTVNGNTTVLDTGDATGLLSGATVDGYNGVYEYTNGFNSSTGKFSDVFSSTEGGYSTNPMVIKGWGWTNTGESIQSVSGTSARSVTFKINTILPVTGINVTATGFNNNVNTGLVELSHDNSTYTTLWDLPASASTQTNTIASGYVNGNKTFYIRLSKDTTNGYIRWDDLKITALINTSTIDTPELFYQTGTNTVNITSYGNAVSSTLDPSLQANVSLIEGATATSISADFTASNTSGIQPLLVQFTDTSTTTDATIDSWSWDFGDGNTSALQSPSHTYEVVGTHTVNLTITNTSLSLVSTKLGSVTVYKVPVADFSSFNTQGTAPFTTYLYDTSTNLNAGPYTYYWDLGDGNTSTNQGVLHTWNETGSFTVKHSITDSVTTVWQNRTDYITVVPAVVAPVASFYGGPQLGPPPLQVFFTDVSTNTPTGWNWSLGDGTFSEAQNPIHWYNSSGFYTVVLTASNGAGSNTSSQQNFVMVY